MPSTSTTSSPTSTRCRTARVKLLSSVETLNYSTGCQPQQRLSKPMETGLSCGIVWLKPCSLCSNTEDPSYSATEGTSNAISQRYPFSTTTESSIMTEQSELEPLNAETLTCQTPLSSATYKSNGLTTHQTPFSVIQRDLLTKNQRSPRERERKVAGVLPVEDGTKVDVPMPQLPATTYISAPIAQTQDTSQAIVIPQARSRHSHPSLRWERRHRFVREYVWTSNEKQGVLMALFSETASPLPRPPENELSSLEKWEIICTHSHLFRITTPIRADRLHDLLSKHPNQLLVESVDEGLKHGFWPWAVTKNSTAPSIIDNARL